MQGDIEYYKGHLRHLQTLSDCLRKDLDDLRRQNSTLKWKKCDLEREIVRLNSTAECLRQRVRTCHCHYIGIYLQQLLRYDTIRYDTLKADISLLSLPHGTKLKSGKEKN